MRRCCFPTVTALCLLGFAKLLQAQPLVDQGDQQKQMASVVPIVLKPARVWDGVALEPHDGWIVIVRGELIEAAGPPGKSRFLRMPVSSTCPAQPYYRG